MILKGRGKNPPLKGKPCCVWWGIVSYTTAVMVDRLHHVRCVHWVSEPKGGLSLQVREEIYVHHRNCLEWAPLCFLSQVSALPQTLPLFLTPLLKKTRKRNHHPLSLPTMLLTFPPITSSQTAHLAQFTIHQFPFQALQPLPFDLSFPLQSTLPPPLHPSIH